MFFLYFLPKILRQAGVWRFMSGLLNGSRLCGSGLTAFCICIVSTFKWFFFNFTFSDYFYYGFFTGNKQPYILLLSLPAAGVRLAAANGLLFPQKPYFAFLFVFHCLATLNLLLLCVGFCFLKAGRALLSCFYPLTSSLSFFVSAAWLIATLPLHSSNNLFPFSAFRV